MEGLWRCNGPILLLWLFLDTKLDASEQERKQ